MQLRKIRRISKCFRICTINGLSSELVEMVFAKGDLGIASLYDKLLVSKELCPFGERLRSKYEETKGFLLKVAGHKDILEKETLT
ncbi:Phosphoenolpyruvate carboxylase 2 [Trifolium repens]|nr:Phosphoenolpyruvate carboxylase 2 [Trifolium repens]WJX69837.1 Phosphoenolpyruvate carboxylase 2 [Trifolium repens]